ncbi:MAG: glycine dehydrogenase, partial [Armatimonadota bacterium]
MSYIPNTDADRQRMLSAIGVRDIADLFAPLGEEVRKRADFSGVAPALDDITLKRHLLQLSGKNVHMDQYPCFLGAGIYDHYIPPIVGHITGRSEFYTAYTPYQPEVSQGVLQSIYEFQTLICQLTGMEVSNASMYDGATALAEAAIMACDITKRKGVVMASSVHPAFRQTVRTYLPMLSESVLELPFDAATGSLDMGALDAALSDTWNVRAHYQSG